MLVAGFQQGLWVRRNPNGNLSWSAGGRGPEHQFLRFDVSRGVAWPTGLHECADSLKMYEEYAVASTPCGRFDGVREIGDIHRCMDFGWGVKLARGVGPVVVTYVTIGGTREFLLKSAVVKDDDCSAPLAGPK